MKSFVTSLVQRGVGLPLPVTIRPAAGPESISNVAASIRAIPDPDPTAQPVDNVQAMAAHPAIPDSAGGSVPLALSMAELRTRGGFSVQTPKRTSSEEKDTFSKQQNPPSPALPAGILQVRVRDAVRLAPRSDHDGQSYRRLEQMAAVSASPASQGDNTIRPGASDREPGATRTRQRHHDPDDRHRGVSSVSGSVRIVPRKDSVGSDFPGRRVAASPAMTRSTAKPESRNIQVKIGRVEIRSSQPAAPVRAAVKRTTAGFADLSLARAYLDRSPW